MSTSSSRVVGIFELRAINLDAEERQYRAQLEAQAALRMIPSGAGSDGSIEFVALVIGTIANIVGIADIITRLKKKPTRELGLTAFIQRDGTRITLNGQRKEDIVEMLKETLRSEGYVTRALRYIPRNRGIKVRLPRVQRPKRRKSVKSSITPMKKSYKSEQLVRVSGTCAPNDIVVVSIINPRANLVATSQVKADRRGRFRSTLMRFPTEQSDSYPEGRYKIIVRGQNSRTASSNIMYHVV